MSKKFHPADSCHDLRIFILQKLLVSASQPPIARANPPNQADSTAPSWRFQAGVALALFLAVLITRLPTFFRSVMDWDESLYFLMAEQWRAGHLPYTAIWDNKPIGIYGVFALFQSWLGDTIISIRIAAVLFISVTAFAIFKIALAIPVQRCRSPVPAALFASAAYVICSLTNDGLSANTEIFMACFTVLAVLSALSGRALLAGLLIGMAFMTKYVAVFEFPAIAFAVLALRPGLTLKSATRRSLALLTGAAMPLALTILLYAGSGHLHAWLEDSILSNFRRIDVPVSMPALGYAIDIELARWSPLFLISLIMLGMAATRLPRLLIHKTLSATARFNLFLALWLAGGCLGVASAKSFFDHYFLQILPVMCVTLAWLPLNLGLTRRLRRFPALLLCAAVLALPLVAAAAAVSQAATPILALTNGHFSLRRDTPARIAHEIQPLLPKPADTAFASGQLFVFDYQPIIYSLDRQLPPTKYLFPSVLTKCQLARVAKAPAMHEILRILATNPEFIIRSRYPYQDPTIVNLRVYAAVDRTLAARYQIWRSYDDAVVYRLRAPNAPVNQNFASLPAACPTA
jgi:4-amino-4-deoxy-L-arabinose transferase-like glycosyltransferase